jgi:hypothetical protein
MPKKDTVIYDPPKKGFPHLVVRVLPSGVDAIAVDSHSKARQLLLKMREARDREKKK